MAYIDMIAEEDAEGALRELYARLTGREGSVDNILKIHSLNVPSLAAHLKLYKTLMYGASGLSRARREMIAVTVSVLNHCHYWIVHHGEGLLVLTKNEELVERLQAGDRTVITDPAETAMLAYVEKLTLAPATVGRADVRDLAGHGFTDADILDIAQVTAYYAFVNRIADGLGVELEPHRRWA